MAASADPRPKVCVVVAAYNSPPELDSLVASLAAQRWAPEHWEVRFVDDGSTDDTFDRLTAYARRYPNFHVERIENSGWPGRPRNVAVAATDAEYVFFSDHDDYVFPEALRRMYEFAAAHDLDVLHPKEVVSGWVTPGWRSWLRQEGRVEALDQHLLQCITPHKLYRRSFLLRHDIRFPEGPVRLEDFSYNGDVWARTDKIGVLADYPCYRWMIYDDNSHKGGYDFDVYWSSFESSLQPIAAMPDSEKKDHLLVRWYRSRILERMAGALHKHGEGYRRKLLARVADLMPYFPERVDRLLSPADRARSALLRAQDVEGLLALSRLDHGVRLAATSSSARWTAEGLQLTVTARVVAGDGEPVRFRRRPDGAVVRDLPARLADAVGDAAVFPQGAEMVPEITLRGRTSNVDWVQPTVGEAGFVDDEGGLVLETTARATIDPATAALGAPLDSEVQDLFFRLVGPGLTATHRIPAFGTDASPAVLDGVTAVVYRTKPGFLAIDLGSKVRTVVGTSQPTPQDVSRRFGVTTVRLPKVTVRGRVSLAMQVEVDGAVSRARLRTDDTGARVETRTRWEQGQDVRVVLEGRRSASLFR